VDALPVEEAARRIQSKAIRAHLVAGLDNWARSRRRKEASGTAADWRRLLKVACAADPDPWRTAVRKAWEADDVKALADLAAAAPDAEEPVPTLLCLWTRLDELTNKDRRGEELIALLRRQQRRHPANFWINYELASALTRLQPPRWEEATCFMRVALALRPQSADVQLGLGYLLGREGNTEEAIALYKEARRLMPGDPCACSNLGFMLLDQGQLNEAMAFLKEAIRIQPNFPQALLSFVALLKKQGTVDQAVTLYRQLVPRESKLAAAGYNNLGWALINHAAVDEAIVCFREAIALGDDDSTVRDNLADALMQQRKVDEAIACLRDAIRIKPNEPGLYFSLGDVLMWQCRFADGLEALRRSRELGCKSPRIAPRVQECEQLVALAPRLPAVLKGEARPAGTAEQTSYALLCYYEKYYAASARFWADAFAAEPKLADDVSAVHRYRAARAAALAGAGQGADAKELGELEQARWRQQALAWLQADLAHWAERLKQGDKKGPTGANSYFWLGYWQSDPDFASVRDEAALRKLPEAEQQAWRKFWEEVEALRWSSRRS
jgi:Flp pilus assembly protein TadD